MAEEPTNATETSTPPADQTFSGRARAGRARRKADELVKRATHFRVLLDPDETVELIAAGVTSRWWDARQMLPPFRSVPGAQRRHVVLTNRHLYVCQGSSAKPQVLTKQDRKSLLITGRKERHPRQDLHRGLRAFRLEIEGNQTVHVYQEDRDVATEIVARCTSQV